MVDAGSGHRPRNGDLLDLLPGPHGELAGASLDPLPPEASKQKDVRYLHIYEDQELDEVQFTDWVRQASRLPGEKM